MEKGALLLVWAFIAVFCIALIASKVKPNYSHALDDREIIYETGIRGVITREKDGRIVFRYSEEDSISLPKGSVDEFDPWDSIYYVKLFVVKSMRDKKE